jgi:trans-aconitate 2-methyltransferase
MPVWDPDVYLAFAANRARPFHDLVARVGTLFPSAPASIVDLAAAPAS